MSIRSSFSVKFNETPKQTQTTSCAIRLMSRFSVFTTNETSSSFALFCLHLMRTRLRVPSLLRLLFSLKFKGNWRPSERKPPKKNKAKLLRRQKKSCRKSKEISVLLNWTTTHAPDTCASYHFDAICLWIFAQIRINQKYFFYSSVPPVRSVTVCRRIWCFPLAVTISFVRQQWCRSTTKRKEKTTRRAHAQIVH